MDQQSAMLTSGLKKSKKSHVFFVHKGFFTALNQLHFLHKYSFGMYMYIFLSRFIDTKLCDASFLAYYVDYFATKASSHDYTLSKVVFGQLGYYISLMKTPH